MERAESPTDDKCTIFDIIALEGRTKLALNSASLIVLTAAIENLIFGFTKPQALGQRFEQK